jgi:hypothetical protein
VEGSIQPYQTSARSSEKSAIETKLTDDKLEIIDAKLDTFGRIVSDDEDDLSCRNQEG